jgi:hypothetical protein
MRSTKNYKILYHDCTKQSDDKDSLIVLLQQQLTQLVLERQSLTAVIANQQGQLAGQAAQISEQQIVMEHQRRTIGGQIEKLVQQQTIIQDQNSLITTQQTTLEKNKKELLRLDNLRYEMTTLKKWIYGIKSEKRYQPAEQSKATVGDQLVLQMEVDNWAVCKINDRRKISEHLRIIKSTTPKKPGGRHDFPAGLQEEITILDAADKPANARCVGHVDQRQLACDPMRWYIKVTRRLSLPGTGRPGSIEL